MGTFDGPLSDCIQSRFRFVVELMPRGQSQPEVGSPDASEPGRARHQLQVDAEAHGV